MTNKKIGKRILGMMSSWDAKKKKATNALKRDIKIMILNGVCMAYHRGQFASRITVAAEYDGPYQSDNLSFREAEEASEEIVKFLRENGCHSEVNRNFLEGENKRIIVAVTVVTAGIPEISKSDIANIRRMHWRERNIRSEKEGGPRQRKMKKAGKKKK